MHHCNIAQYALEKVTQLGFANLLHRKRETSVTKFDFDLSPQHLNFILKKERS